MMENHLSIEALTAAAQAGDAEAQCQLAAQNMEGDKKAQKAAFLWAKKAAKAQSARGMFLLSRCYNLGIGVRPSEDKAEDWLKKAADQGDKEAQMMLAMRYIYSSFADEREKGLAFIQQNAETGHPLARYLLATLLISGRELEQDYEKGYQLLKTLQAEGHPQCLPDLALFEIDGYPNGRDVNAAIRLLEKSIEVGYAKGYCHYLLADIYCQGYAGEVERNLDLARQHLKAAAAAHPQQYASRVKRDLQELDYWEQHPEEADED